MKHARPILLVALAALTAWSAPQAHAATVQTVLAKPVDQAETRFKAKVVEDLGKNKFLVEDGGKRIEVKSGPHWYHTLPLQNGQTHTFDGALHVKDKDGERKVELKLVRGWRADGARLDVRPNAKSEPWKAVGKEKAHASAPIVLSWRKP